MSQDNLPAPLVPAECNLQTLQSMLLDVQRLRDSNFSATVDPAAGFFAVMLWCAAWHQDRAGSLPNDNASLAKLAGLGRDLNSWHVYREAGALYGFIKCSDGRLYHPVISMKALVQWLGRLNSQLRSGKGNQARFNTPFDKAEIERKIGVAQASIRRLIDEFGDKLADVVEGTTAKAPAAIPGGDEQGTQVNRSEVKSSEGNPPIPPAGVETKAKKAAKQRKPKAETAAADPLAEPRYSPGFERFWAAYPPRRKSGKQDAWKAWQKHGLEDATDVLVRNVTERQTEDNAWVKDGGEFIPMPSTYLNGKRWNDVMVPVANRAGARTSIEQSNASTADAWANTEIK